MNKATVICACILAITIICCGITLIYHFSQPTYQMGNLYPETGIVKRVNTGTDIVVVELANGHLFTFTGAEDWFPKDICSLLMADMGTESVLDDQIVQVRYSGVSSSWMWHEAVDRL